MHLVRFIDIFWILGWVVGWNARFFCSEMHKLGKVQLLVVWGTFLVKVFNFLIVSSVLLIKVLMINYSICCSAYLWSSCSSAFWMITVLMMSQVEPLPVTAIIMPLWHITSLVYDFHECVCKCVCLYVKDSDASSAFTQVLLPPCGLLALNLAIRLSVLLLQKKII